jgi:hypothetical protein
MAYEHTEFYASDVEKIVGVKRTRLHSWIESGWLKPSIQKGAGSGSRNIFSRMDLYNIRMFKNLIDLGLSRKMIGLCFQSIADQYSHFHSSRIDEIEFWVWGIEGGVEGKERKIFPSVILSSSLKESVDFHLTRGFIENEPYFDYTFFDNIFMFNFRRIREEIDSKIEEIKG